MSSLINLANTLTVGRILLVPVVVAAVLVATPHGSLAGAAVFAAVAFTDGLDGHLARARHSVTKFGRVMDPIADKVLIAAALVSLVTVDRLAAWVATVIIAREFAVSAVRVAASTQGISIPANSLGKLKTAVQVAAVTVLIAAPDPAAVWVEILVYVAVAATVGSGLDYLLSFRRELSDSRQLARRNHA